ncbi:uncharacterized protein N0V89_012011 [Didymosphaeria variabile]|uniref:Uncharacterized protein n=1 Tax=Didymosphaeria variabile TaxID=1932322 RepID=A0A9W8XAS5_9PLEO|nr:uncharacterized protein N0V89_012011 [Didymosphaeria variabile]KAJ4345875.1 hypothetical protein N0V89_012011 [Didymosphaeria variabile]
MIYDQALLLRCDERSTALPDSAKGNGRGISDNILDNIFDTPLPPSNPALNLALAGHQLKDEIMERAKAMSVPFTGEFKKLAGVFTSEFTWTHPMPLALPKQEQSPTQCVDINFLVRHVTDGAIILEPICKLLVNIISNGSARKICWNDILDRKLDRIALPVYAIREARINITTNLSPHDIAPGQGSETAAISQQVADSLIWCALNDYFNDYCTLFDIYSYVVSHVGSLVVSIDGQNYRDIDLAAELLAPNSSVGPGPAHSGYSVLIKAVLQETRRRQGLDGPSIDVAQGPFTVPRPNYVDFGSRTYSTQAKFIRRARELGFVVHYE